MIHGTGIWDSISRDLEKREKGEKKAKQKSPTPFAWVISQP
jgi:hypothetical protein